MSEHLAALVCWCCRDEKPVVMSRAPNFGFEVVAAAVAVGWLGLTDIGSGRVVIVCSGACKEAALTKRGALRRFRPKAPELMDRLKAGEVECV